MRAAAILMRRHDPILFIATSIEAAALPRDGKALFDPSAGS